MPADATRRSGDWARRTSLPPEAVLGAWRALSEGRWPIVETLERDGRRFVVARPDAPLGLPSSEPPGEPRQLSAQETRVLVALAKGHSNKLIAYDLGLATSTVGTLIARAARKLGCQNRLALAREGRALMHSLAGDPA